MGSYLNLRLKIRLIIGIILCLVLGVSAVIMSIALGAGREPYEEVYNLIDMSNSELKDGLMVKGRAYSAVGKLIADFGEGERVYVLAALDTKEYMLNNTDSTKEVFVLLDVEAAVDKSPKWFDEMIKSELHYLENGMKLPNDTFDIECRLRTLPTNFPMSNIYAIGGSYVPQSNILPLYAEPHYIDPNAPKKPAKALPIWYGIVLLAVGAGLFALYLFKYHRS